MKPSLLLALTATALTALSSARAEYLNTYSDVISLPAFVVEATRIDAPASDLVLSLDATLRKATGIAERTSDRALGRLKARLTGGSRHPGFARPGA